MHHLSLTPTIKGVFVNSHVKAVQKRKGEAGVRSLARMYGSRIHFRYLEDVPIREEIRIIECALDILSGGQFPSQQRAFEAGRLHFRNFSATPLGRLVLTILPQRFKSVMLGIPSISKHVFRNVRFIVEDVGPHAVKVVMVNNDYPAEHFRGLFYEWLRYAGCPGEVSVHLSGTDTYEYTLRWNPTPDLH